MWLKYDTLFSKFEQPVLGRRRGSAAAQERLRITTFRPDSKKGRICHFCPFFLPSFLKVTQSVLHPGNLFFLRAGFLTPSWNGDYSGHSVRLTVFAQLFPPLTKGDFVSPN